MALSGTDTYADNTTIHSETLSVFQIYLADSSTVSIGPAAKLNLNFAGADVIACLMIGESHSASGTWGASN